ncbi:ribonuclease H-like domain-containing protein [Brucepastera parasyntrophica]|uniref:ribonuclease H-like domain-containing protein n=1 Tax=Brucepastera parasyntrophica TaxID=2880008 RepID=UPI00210B1FD6|nr:ribonuclease H-like domain-containing protein [Brucepastera parasyntrophica]ULQ60076.1 ribonuclease H-like domain-containing protein [Brucepastera parasyntrophica]
MANSRLSGRLNRIREKERKNGAELQNVIVSGEAETVAGFASPYLPGWENTAPFLYERIHYANIPCFRSGFSASLPLLFPREKKLLEKFPVFLPDQSDEETSYSFLRNLVFFDIETTGLSHGAGTIAFMVGFARFTEPGILAVHQLLISDYPGEPELLEKMCAIIGTNPVFVSFNGKCFDSSILVSRLCMNRISGNGSVFSSNIHLDLLFPSRVLWKRELGSCRLSILENQILGVSRLNDLPGSEAPDAWFEFVRTGTMDRLLAVGEHNLEDCISLARLLFRLDSAIEEGEGRAALVRALDLRSQKKYEEARIFLEPLAHSGDALAAKILAIDLEHRLSDLEQALMFAEKNGDLHRAERIKRKMLRN